MSARNFIDLSGMTFTRLKVIERAENDKQGKPMFLCQCQCGRKVVVRGRALRSGHTRSCICLHRDTLAAINLHRKEEAQGRHAATDH